jgi:short-subunit dehydrogenase
MRAVISPGSFQDKVVVVTGASAGVGRATARAFVEAGAHVGLVARPTEGLEQTRAELAALNGGKVVALPADVANAEQVFAAAAQCEQALGAVDIWVNNAMVTVFSTLEKIDAEELRRITEVTYMGYVYGTLAALAQMRRQGSGTIVQVGSALAYRSIPLQAGYCGAKHAIRGFTDSLRTELIHAGSKIALTAVHLPAMNTPQFDWARTHCPTEPRPAGPVYQPQVAARAILRAARAPQREYWVGTQTPLIILANMLMPGWLDRYLAGKAISGQATDRPVKEDRGDNLFQPVAGGHAAEGSFGAEARNNAWVWSSSTMRAIALGTVCVAAGMIGARLGARLARRRKRLHGIRGMVSRHAPERFLAQLRRRG